MTYQSAGWYPDPKDRRIERWFDGAGWSDHVRAVDDVRTVEDVPPVVPYRVATMPGGRSGRARKAAAVPVSLAITLAAVKVALLVTHLVSEAHENARPDAPPPAVVAEQPAPADAEPPAPPATQEFPFREAALEREIVDRLAAEQGLTVTVACPPNTPAVIPGMEFLCSVDAEGTQGSADVVIIANGDWTWTYLPETSSLPPR